MKVRYSYLKQQFSNCDDLWRDLKRFVPTGDFTLGKPLQKFEKSFAKLIGTKYAVGVNSGTDAIKLSLKCLGVGHGDEVITAANTFVATVGAIMELGAKPVFADVLDDQNIVLNASVSHRLTMNLLSCSTYRLLIATMADYRNLIEAIIRVSV